MRIQLSDHFTYRRLIRFVVPSVCMMLVTSVYGIVDGLFVSNFVGKDAFAVLNLILPFPQFLSALGFIFGAGGSAVVAIALGIGKRDHANQYFSMIIYVAIAWGILVSCLGHVLVKSVAVFLGAEGIILEYCVAYGHLMFLSLPCYMLQIIFQSFMVTAEKPRFGLMVTLMCGGANILLDFLLICVFQMGIVGAGIATVVSEIIGGLTPLIYFSRKNNSLLRLVRVRIKFSIIFKTCTNGLSELMTNLSTSLVNMLYNFQLMRLAGSDGVAAFGVIMYSNWIFSAVFMGYSVGSAPLVSYHYGAVDEKELKNLFFKSLKIISGVGLILYIVALVGGRYLVQIFVGYDTALMELTMQGFYINSFSFLIFGFNIWGSSFFTALGNGWVSAVVSFLRVLLFQTASVLMLPVFLGLKGVFMAGVTGRDAGGNGNIYVSY